MCAQTLSVKSLENTCVRLEPLSEAFRKPLQATVAQAEPGTWKHMLKDAQADFDEWFRSYLESHERNTQKMFVVIDCASEKVVGATSFMNIALEHRRLEIGATWYLPSMQGTAVNPACKLLLLAYAFDEIGINRVEMKCDVHNLRSRRAIIKLGAKEEGVLREHMQVPDGQGGQRFRDTVYHSILRAEWLGVKARLCSRLESIFAPA